MQMGPIAYVQFGFCLGKQRTFIFFRNYHAKCRYYVFAEDRMITVIAEGRFKMGGHTEPVHNYFICLQEMPKEFVVDMEETYPFGELGEVLNEDTKAVVRKALKFEGEEERAIIKQMVHFLKAARHESLINVERMLEGPGEVQLYYEYAPFKLQRWIVSVNEELLAALEEQMLELAEYLTRSSLKFDFNPDYLGLSGSMTIKYFLNEFSLDFEDQQQHFQSLKVQIANFFKELACSANPKEEIEDTKQCSRLGSLSTNASISPLDDFITLTSNRLKKCEEKGSKSSQLSEKVENSMKKSLQALMRFKRGSK